MKKLFVLFLGIVMCVALNAQTYALENIQKSSVRINGTDYNCSSNTASVDFAGDLGDRSFLDFGGKCEITENTSRMATHDINVKLYYSFDKSNWTEISLISEVESFTGSGYKYTYYSKYNQTVSLSGFSINETCTLYVYFKASQSTSVKTDPVINSETNPYEATFTRIADIAFTNGSSFSPTVSEGSTDQAIGRFYLSADVSGAELTAASVTLSGIRTGFSNIKLWSSADAVFDGDPTDTQLGTTIASDPGASPADFSGFSSAIETGGTYYFVTADVAEGATGSIRGTLEDDGDLTVSSGSVSQTLSSETLSSSDLALPIELQYFTAEARNGAVEVRWETASETENSHFLLSRDDEVLVSIPGHGASAEPHCYAYSDRQVEAGKVYAYALADVSFGGEITRHASVNVEIGSNADVFKDLFLEKVYPNPFNPKITAVCRLAEDSGIELSIYNTSGERVAELFRGDKRAGTHEISWNASGMASGVYILNMRAGNTLQCRKIVLMK